MHHPCCITAVLRGEQGSEDLTVGDGISAKPARKGERHLRLIELDFERHGL